MDYTKKADAAIFTEATKPLDTPFNIEDPNTRLLLVELNHRAANFGWDDILSIPVDGTDQHSPDACGVITTTAANAHVDGYINTQGHSQQMDVQLLTCLQSTLDAKSKKLMANKSAEYMRPGAAPGDPKKTSGIMCLHAILQKVEAQSRVVGATIRKELAALDKCMVEEADCKIPAFNECVKAKINRLTNLKQTATDVLDNIFDAHETVPDEDFKLFTREQRSKYEQGDNTDMDELLNKAEALHTNKQLRKKWNQPSAEHEQIVALKAELESIKKTPTQTAPRKPNEKATPPSSEGGDPKKKRERYKKGPDGIPLFTGKDKWRLNEPGPGDPHAKTVDGQLAKFCKWHGFWCSHLSDDCREKEKLQAKRAAAAAAATGTDITAAMAQVGIEDVVSDDEE